MSTATKTLSLALLLVTTSLAAGCADSPPGVDGARVTPGSSVSTMSLPSMAGRLRASEQVSAGRDSMGPQRELSPEVSVVAAVGKPGR